MNVLVLCGGESAERVVSWASGDAVAAWLEQAGHHAMKYDPEKPGALRTAADLMAPPEIGVAAPPTAWRNGYDPRTVRGLLQAMDAAKPDIVFPILHGGRGEDGTLQALLDWVGMPYTGSGASACKLAMNKHQSRMMFQAAGIPVAAGFVADRKTFRDVAAIRNEIERLCGFPVVVKPLCGGSTVGLTKVYEPDGLVGALREIGEQHDDALIEALFDGRELTVAVVDGAAYPIVEIRPKIGFYDYANKYNVGRTEYLCPAPIPSDTALRMQTQAVEAYRILGCADFARVDFLLNGAGEFICLEVNTLPGMTHHSLVPKAARARGEEPPGLMQKILDSAARARNRF
ncbi:MAG: D-alanine--D-alanine ligase [bacterium]|nr:D-alanine--D-alanine ligase [bacterium]